MELFIGMDSKDSLTSWSSDKNVLLARSRILGCSRWFVDTPWRRRGPLEWSNRSLKTEETYTQRDQGSCDGDSIAVAGWSTHRWTASECRRLVAKIRDLKCGGESRRYQNYGDSRCTKGLVAARTRKGRYRIRQSRKGRKFSLSHRRCALSQMLLRRQVQAPVVSLSSLLSSLALWCARLLMHWPVIDEQHPDSTSCCHIVVPDFLCVHSTGLHCWAACYHGHCCGGVLGELRHKYFQGLCMDSAY